MKILLVHNFYQQQGGEDIAFASERAALEEAGHSVTTMEVKNEDITNLSDKIAVAASAVWSRKGYDMVSATLARDRPDVMHVHNFFPQISPAVFDAAVDAGVASVMTLHNFRITCASPYLLRNGAICERCVDGSALWALRYRCYRGSIVGSAVLSRLISYHKQNGSWNRVNRLIALNSFATSIFVRAGIEPERLMIKPNCLADPFEGKDIPETSERSGALFVGRLSEEKGIEILLEAWRSLDQPLTVLGDGPLMEKCRAEASGNVIFLGQRSRDEILERMRNAKILVVPSIWYEMFQLVLIEAFSAGLPVLVSNIGALPEIVLGTGAGATFEVGNAEALCEAARGALDRPDQLRDWGQAARTAFLERFEASLDARRLERIYHEAIDDLRSTVSTPE